MERHRNVRHEEALAAENVPEGRRGEPGVAAARLDDSRSDAAGTNGCSASRPSRIRLHPARRHHGPVDACDRGCRIRVHADSQAARAVPRSPERRQRTWPSRRRYDRGPLTQPDDVAQRSATEGNPGCRRLRRRDRRPDRCTADRSGHRAPVDGAGHRRSFRPDRVVRSRLRLHLHEHVVVAYADDADADGDQSAESVRADVRPGRQRNRAARAHQGGQEHPRRDHKGRGDPAGAARSVGSPDDDAVPRERARDRAPHSARRDQPGRRRSPVAGAACRRAVRLRGTHQVDVQT